MSLLAAFNPVGVYFVVRELDPFWAAAIRFTVAGFVFWLVMAVLRVPLPRGPAALGAVIYGVVGFFLSFALIFWGQQETPPGTAGLLLALMPLFTILLARLHGLERIAPRSIIGAAIALVGVGIVVADRISLDVPLLSVLALIGAALCLAETGIIIKLTPSAHPVATNAIALTVGGLMLGALSVLAGEDWTLPETGGTWAAMAFLILGGSVGVFGLFIYVLGRLSATTVSYELLISAVVTAIYSALLTDEVFTWSLAAGGAVVLVGVYAGVFTGRRRALAPAEAMPAVATEANNAAERR